jgi:menaquinol-cytochrome c reductase cytochrome b subunit
MRAVRRLRSCYRWLDDRLGIDDALGKSVLHRTVPRQANFSFCFGGLSFLLFVLLFVTGCFMTLYYVPSVDHAHDSVDFMMYEVSLGAVVRSAHHWSASLIVVTLVIHMARVFVYGAYKRPRELNWMTGVALLGLTLASAFTGHLLPWDQKGYWATKVGAHIVRSTPWLGEYLYAILLGGPEIGAVTLVRFYALHVIFLPITTVCLLLAHFWMIRRHGIKYDL